MKKVLLEQKDSYNNTLEDVMVRKHNYVTSHGGYDEKIFDLEQSIKINNRATNRYAVMRDEIQINSYLLLNNQREMILDILKASDSSDADSFKQKVQDIIVKNSKENKAIIGKNYDYIFAINASKSKVIKKAQKNLIEFHTLVEINNDIINHLFLYEKQMFKLNKYAKYHLIDLVLYINSVETLKNINQYLASYGLDIAKMIFIVLVYLMIFILRKIINFVIGSNLLQEKLFKKYASEILTQLQKTITFLIIIININITIYIYNDFSTTEIVTTMFNMLYGVIFTIFVYRIINIIAEINIDSIGATQSNVKKEVINVSIKIVNFLIIIMGMLIVLYFGGVDLTAVLSGLGIGGFAVALAAKDSLANFFGTLSILISDVFSQGDWIEANNQEGVVVEIGLRVTTLRTFDNALVAIPNAILANQDVKNWNKRRLGRRIKMKLGIKYDSKPSDIKKAVDDIRDMLEKHPDIATKNTKNNYDKRRRAKLVSKDDFQGIKKTLLVYLDEFSDSSIDILVYCFTKNIQWDSWLSTKDDIMHQIMIILEDNSLEFAFPSLSIYDELK